MSVGPFPVSSVIDRLSAVAALRLVGGAADLQAILATMPNAAPAAFVLSDERGDKPKGFSGGPQIQNANVSLRVVHFVRNASGGSAGEGARKEMDEIVLPATRARLLAWGPDDSYVPLWFIASREESFKAGWLVVQEMYGSTYRISATRQP